MKLHNLKNGAIGILRDRLGVEIHRTARAGQELFDVPQWRWDREAPRRHEYDLVACAIFKNEAPYLAEWIEFHLLQGVQKFFLYNNNSDDDYLRALAPYLQDGTVYLHNWPQQPPCQIQAYHHCLGQYGFCARWMAFLDIDEYLFPAEERPLLEVLNQYQEYAAVAVHWIMFSTSGHVLKPDGLLLENFTQRQNSVGKIVKIIVDPRRVARVVDPHSAIFEAGETAVNEKRQSVWQSFSLPPTAEVLRINHYWTKSVEEFLKKTERITAHRAVPRRANELIAAERTYAGAQDFTIQRYLPELKARLKERFDS